MRLLIPALVNSRSRRAPPQLDRTPAVCTNLSGVRVDNMNPGHTFTPHAQMGPSWAYTWDVDTKQATLIFQAAKAAGGLPEQTKGSGERFTGAGSSRS